MPEPEEVVQGVLTQHWMFAGPGQWLGREKPWVVQAVVGRQVPSPEGVVQGSARGRRRGVVGVARGRRRRTGEGRCMIGDGLGLGDEVDFWEEGVGARFV